MGKLLEILNILWFLLLRSYCNVWYLRGVEPQLFRLRAYHNHTAFFQAYAENCTPTNAVLSWIQNAMLNVIFLSILPCSYIVDFSLTERTSLSSGHTRVALDRFYIWRSVHNFWELGIQEAQ